jgi:ABC-type branched-subunit amino acid transport system substrate-binding protein
MNHAHKFFLAVVIVACLGFLALPLAMAANSFFDPYKMGDMSDFDPSNPVIPTGDTIKIAIVASFSGPAAAVGDIYFASVQSVAHDYNKRGGIMVDGKKKLVQVIKANHESKVPIAKKVSERMVLQEKVDVLWGTNGSHLMKVINQVADKYKTIAVSAAAVSDELYDAQNFTRYSFMTSFSTQQIGRGIAYFYGQIRKKEKKFYILCQDYLFGHSMAEGFKEGLQEYYPAGELVGEDYHKLFLTDFAPYLTKIKASGAEVVYTGDWIPDAANLLVQARQMGLDLPFANIFINNPPFLIEVGVEGTKGLVHLEQFGAAGKAFKNPGQIKYFKAWADQYPKWGKPYNTTTYTHGTGTIGAYRMQTYWLLDVIERAGSTDPEKIIKVWENDTWADVSGNVYKMRAIDHKTERDLFIEIYVPPEEQKQSMNIEPYYWFKGCSMTGPSYRVPAEKVLPKLDPKIKEIRKGY